MDKEQIACLEAYGQLSTKVTQVRTHRRTREVSLTSSAPWCLRVPTSFAAVPFYRRLVPFLSKYFPCALKV